jgi:hypothetical protein
MSRVTVRTRLLVCTVGGEDWGRSPGGLESILVPFDHTGSFGQGHPWMVSGHVLAYHSFESSGASQFLC